MVDEYPFKNKRDTKIQGIEKVADSNIVFGLIHYYSRLLRPILSPLDGELRLMNAINSDTKRKFKTAEDVLDDAGWCYYTKKNWNFEFALRKFNTISNKGGIMRYKDRNKQLQFLVLLDNPPPQKEIIMVTKSGVEILYSTLFGGCLLAEDPTANSKMYVYKLIGSSKGVVKNTRLKFAKDINYILKQIHELFQDRVSSTPVKRGKSPHVNIEYKTQKAPIQHEIYVQKLKAPFFECCKFGISQDSEHRSRTQHKTSMFAHQLIKVWKVADKPEALRVEKLVKQNFRTGVAMKAWMNDGYTETCSIEDMYSIIEFIDKNVLEDKQEN